MATTRHVVIETVRPLDEVLLDLMGRDERAFPLHPINDAECRQLTKRLTNHGSADAVGRAQLVLGGYRCVFPPHTFPNGFRENLDQLVVIGNR